MIGSAGAAVLEDLAKDFRPLAGYVIMPVGGEFLIDQDAARGVQVGDLFAVVKPGEKIVHPVTKEVLGTLDEDKGMLQVTRVKSGYSYARPLGEVAGIERGDVIRRYENVSAALWDYTGSGETFFAELKAALPSLEWQDYAAAQAERPQVPAAVATSGPALVFVLSHNGLEVRDADFRAIRAYSRPESLQGAVPGTVVPSAPATAPVALVTPPAALPVPSPECAVKWELAPAKGGQKARYGATYPGYANVGDLPGRTVMADFARDGDRILLAVTDGSAVGVFVVDDSLVPVATGDTAMPGKILSLHWWRPTPKGPLYLAVTVSVEEGASFGTSAAQEMKGAIFALQNDRLTAVREGLPYILGSFDRDGDGSRETLLGQPFDLDTFFGGKIRELRLVKGDVEATKFPIKVPRQFPVQGSLFADLTGDGRAETVYVRNGIIYIFAGKKLLYESAKQMGGSLSLVTYDTNPGAKDTLFRSVSFEVPPVAADIDGDGRLELVAVASESSSFRAPGIGPGVKKSWLAVIKYRDGMFVKGTLGEELENPLQGLTVAGDRALLVLSRTTSLLDKAGSSHLLALPLAK